jgi:3-hydroxyisobutyrate dehydrogenase-like beta-hydroxyacid dehydrogenase
MYIMDIPSWRVGTQVQANNESANRAVERGPVGVIGLGFIGAALSERLRAAGFEVIGYDTDAAKARRFAGAGGSAAASLVEVGRRCTCVVIAVFDTAQVIDVVEGPGGLVEAAEGAAFTAICVSTCEPDALATLARRAANAGVSLIELPLVGNGDQVRRGEAVGIIAGDPKALARVNDVLQTLCPRRFSIGAPGDAARAKLAINLVLQLNRSALAEGLVFATRLGLDPAAFLEILSASPAHSDVMETKGEKMLQADFSPQSHIAQTLKDARLILEEARRLAQPLPLMEINTALLAATIELGGPQRDSSAVIEAIRARK